MGNRTHEDITEVVDITGIRKINSKDGKVRLQDMKILKNRYFNLFTISQSLNKGWTLTGNKEYISIKMDKLNQGCPIDNDKERLVVRD
jgi:hypothetical protein